jgi:hypothetical protein
MQYSLQPVSAMSVDNNHIFFTDKAAIGGIFIVFLEFPNKRIGEKLWKTFLDMHAGPIYFSTKDPSYIGNHCKFHGNFGGKKVYQYVRS